MVECGVELNPETAMDLRPRTFQFEAHGIGFRYELQIPEYILQRLNSSILDRLQDYMNGYASGVVLNAMRGGYMHTESGQQRMRSDVGKHLKNYLWQRFSITQEVAGNECWQVAPSLQEVKL